MNYGGDESTRRLQLAKRVAYKYQSIDGIDSVAVGGSTAIRSAYSDSDLDMWVTYSRLPDREVIKQVAQELIEEHGNEPQPDYVIDGHVNSFRLGGIEVVIMFGPNDALQTLPEQLSEYMGTSKEQYAAEYYHIVVLYDPEGVWSRVKRELDDYPVDMGAKIVQTKIEELARAVRDWIPKAIITQNYLYASELRSSVLDEYLRLLFALNKSYYKRLMDVPVFLPGLEIKPAACEQRLVDWTEANSLQEMQQVIMELVKDTIPLIESIYPEVDLGWSLRRLELYI